MPNQITPAGIEVKTQAELLAEQTANFQANYGADIDLASDSPDGQIINDFIQSVLDVEDIVVQTYNSMDPDQAIGVTLDQRVAINGIQREGGTFSQILLTLVVSQNAVLQGIDLFPDSPYTVRDDAGSQWQLLTGVTLAPGTHAGLIFRAANPGAVTAAINSVTIAVTVVLGVDSITNPAVNSITGVAEESDSLLKVRRQRSVAVNLNGYTDKLRAALENITGVTAAFVYENPSDATDISGLPGHSIQAVIDGVIANSVPAWSAVVSYSLAAVVSAGGFIYFSLVNANLNNLVTDTTKWRLGGTVADYPVAAVIYAKRGFGANTFGAETFTITQKDGTPFVVRWDIVASENLFIAFTAKSLNGTTLPNEAAIRAALPTIYQPGIFGEVNINQLATLVQSIDPNTLVLVTTPNEGFSRDGSGGSYANFLSPASKAGRFVVGGSAPRLVITVLPL